MAFCIEKLDYAVEQVESKAKEFNGTARCSEKAGLACLPPKGGWGNVHRVAPRKERCDTVG